MSWFVQHRNQDPKTVSGVIKYGNEMHLYDCYVNIYSIFVLVQEMTRINIFPSLLLVWICDCTIHCSSLCVWFCFFSNSCPCVYYLVLIMLYVFFYQKTAFFMRKMNFLFMISVQWLYDTGVKFEIKYYGVNEIYWSDLPQKLPTFTYGNLLFLAATWFLGPIGRGQETRAARNPMVYIHNTRFGILCVLVTLKR